MSGPAKRAQARTPSKGGVDLYTLDVIVISGPVTEEFAKKNPVISRTIQIRSDQTLADLHAAIFAAFDREEEHRYEFQVGGRGPGDPKSRRYLLPSAMRGPTLGSRKPAGEVNRTTVGLLGLKVGGVFGYWFDFGDDWWHQINVVAIECDVPRGRFPRVTKRVGESPLQYADLDEDE